ncbi:sterile alpha motif domain-containing protein 15-like isoform X2 [Paramacrobiotus metropolitanus]|nr:sterile alpha motif domain-containing protein 15-like isoform X2 [Paramacrobiotus metropolitanus]
MGKTKFFPDIPIDTFKNFVRLQDPYEHARDKERRQQNEPFTQPLYIGTPVYDLHPDEPTFHKTSSKEFLAEATKSYEIVKLDRSAQIIAAEATQMQPIPGSLRSSEERRSFNENKTPHWETLLRRQRMDRVKRSDAKNPLVPRCINWTEEDVLHWLNSIGMGKYEETFIYNGIDGIRLCILETNRLGQMGIHDWDDLKVLAAAIRNETKRPVCPVPHTRNVARKPLEDIDSYLEFKNVRGDRSDFTSFKKFTNDHENVIWNTQEKTLQYPG